MSTRETLHQLIGAPPDSALPPVEGLLRQKTANGGVPPFLVDAPEDDEPLTPEAAASLDRGWDEYRRGQVRSWEEVRGELACE